jgi:hypothetical protein
MENDLRAAIRAMVKEEMTNMLPTQHHDHEAKMAKSELRDMVKLGAELYNMIQEGDNLPGWTSAYITLASDYIHSVHQYMTENKPQ